MAREPHMERWEYQEISTTLDVVLTELNQAGQDGWELVSMHVQPPSENATQFSMRAQNPPPPTLCIAFLKRRIP
jgi:hypothetical protein